jgi:hypothetical protein
MIAEAPLFAGSFYEGVLFWLLRSSGRKIRFSGGPIIRKQAVHKDKGYSDV